MHSAESKWVDRGVVVAALFMWGCNPAPPEAGPPHFVVADVIVSVANQSPREMQISVGTAAVEHQLGAVPGRSSRSFSLPSDLGEPKGLLHFEARARRETTGVRSDTFSVAPGQQVLWVIGEHGSGPITKR